MKAHRKYIRLINLKLDGRLPGAKLDTFERHLERCDSCREEYAHLRDMRAKLLASLEIVPDHITAARRKDAIMAAVKKRAASQRSPYWQLALRPALVLCSLLIVLMISFAVVHKSEPTGPRLFTNPQDVVIDSVLLDTLNDHEIAGLFEVYNEPAEIAAAMKANDQLREGRGR